MVATDPQARRARRIDLALAAALGLVCLAVYLRTMRLTVGWMDSAELTTAAYFLGIGHSPGYPTWMLLAFPFAHLPFGTVAWRVNLMNALLGAVAVALLFLLCRRISRSRAAGLIAAASFAFTATFWDLTGEADVFTLYACFAALALLLVLHWRTHRLDRTLYGLALLLGVGMGNHALLLLLVPALLFLVLAEAGLRVLSATRVVTLLLCFALGLSVYLYLPIRGAADPPPHMNNPRGKTVVQALQATVSYMSAPGARESMFSSGVTTAAHRAWAHVRAVATVEFGWVGAVLGLLGLVLLLRRDWKLAVSLLLMGLVAVAYACNFSIFDIYAYYLPLHLAWALLLAVGVAGVIDAGQWLFARAPAQGRPRSPRLSWAAITLALLALPMLLYARHLAHADRHDDARAEQFSRFVMQHTAAHSVLLGDWWVIAPVGYLKYVEGMRPDLSLDPAAARVSDDEIRAYATPEFLDRFPAVYFAETISDKLGLFRETAYPVPEGPVWRVLPRRPPASEVLVEGPAAPVARFGDQVGLVKAEVAPGPLRANRLSRLTLSWTPLPHYAHAPLEVTLMLRAEDTGEVIWREAVPLGHDLYPRERWQPGQVLREPHAIYLLDPPAPATYRLLLRVRPRGGGGAGERPLLCDRPAEANKPYDYLLARVQGKRPAAE